MLSFIEKSNLKSVDYAFEHLKDDASPEKVFFKIRFQLYSNKITTKKSLEEYQKLLKTVDETSEFTWTGVKDKSRIDSYFDPFGNFSLKRRVRLEIARGYFKLSNNEIFQKEIDLLSEGLNDFKKQMLIVYVQKYLK
jgi:hypothetical protein